MLNGISGDRGRNEDASDAAALPPRHQHRDKTYEGFRGWRLSRVLILDSLLWCLHNYCRTELCLLQDFPNYRITLRIIDSMIRVAGTDHSTHFDGEITQGINGSRLKETRKMIS